MSDRGNNQARALLDAWDTLLRHRWRFIIPTVAVMAGVLIVGMFLPRKYKADAAFERRTDMVLSEITRRGATRKFEDPRQFLEKELAGAPALRAVVETLPKDLLLKTVGNSTSDKENLIGELAREVVVTFDISSPEMDRVRVQFITEYPELGKQVVDEKRAAMETRLHESAAFFEQKVQRHRELIEELENQKLNFEISHGQLLPDTPYSVQTLLMNAQTNLSRLQQQHDSVRMRVQSLTQSLDETKQTTPSIVKGKNPDVVRMETKQRNLENELSKMIGIYKMKPKHPDVQAMQQQLEALKKEIASTDHEIVMERAYSQNPRYSEITLLLTDAKTEEEALAKQITTLHGRIEELKLQSDELFPVRSDYRKLSRKVSEAERQLAFWEDNHRRVELALAAENGNRGVLLNYMQKSNVARKPISPDLAQVFMAALALGLISGTLSVFFAHRTDETFTDGKDLAEAINLPLFGGVSEIISRRQRRIRRLRNMVVYPSNALAICALLASLSTVLYLDIEEPGTLDAWAQQLIDSTDSAVKPRTEQE